MTNSILTQIKQDEQKAASWLLYPDKLSHSARQVVDDVLSIIGEKQRILVKVRREALSHLKSTVKDRGRPGWLIYVQRRYAEELAKLYGVSAEDYWTNPRNLQRIWCDVVDLTVKVGYIKGLFCVVCLLSVHAAQ